MQHKILSSSKHLDFPEEFRCRFISSNSEREVLHSHDYYEIFLTITDNIQHHINGKTNILKKHSLVFVRPNDVHRYFHSSEEYSFINLAVSYDMLNSLFKFLGDSFPVETLLSAKYSPTIHLNDTEKQKLVEYLYNLNTLTWDNSKKRHYYCKMVLTIMFSQHFVNAIKHQDNEIPQWLTDVYSLMHQKDNFIDGIETMIKLSGKTHEHLTRSFKQYYNKTPVDFITDLRLNYAANLLWHSNYSITNIVYECGFNNSGWFFSQFKKKFGVSPSQFRKKKNQKSKIISDNNKQ